MKKLLVILGILILLGGCNQVDDMMNPSEDELMKNVNPEVVMEMDFDLVGELIDVTKGEIQGINTNGNAKGVSQASFNGESYNLLATFENLPDPQGSDFYEGWIVRKGVKFNVLSSGKAEKIDGKYVNMYASGKDLTDHTFYVLTIEPDDGDPAPAGHVLEGTMK
ncbi:hypothetical protein CL618_00135 [archaeon]|nr:hypothetical protein [archaeon]